MPARERACALPAEGGRSSAVVSLRVADEGAPSETRHRILSVILRALGSGCRRGILPGHVQHFASACPQHRPPALLWTFAWSLCTRCMAPFPTHRLAVVVLPMYPARHAYSIDWFARVDLKTHDVHKTATEHDDASCDRRKRRKSVGTRRLGRPSCAWQMLRDELVERDGEQDC
jgi:hypothetical protein